MTGSQRPLVGLLTLVQEGRRCYYRCYAGATPGARLNSRSQTKGRLTLLRLASVRLINVEGALLRTAAHKQEMKERCRYWLPAGSRLMTHQMLKNEPSSLAALRVAALLLTFRAYCHSFLLVEFEVAVLYPMIAKLAQLKAVIHHRVLAERGFL
jgi:hypothetical protein